MRVHVISMPSTSAITVLVHTKVGSRYEPNHLWGASHFIEHLMFKGTDRRPSTVDISRELDQYGAQFNAYTGKDKTGYYVKIDSKHAALAVDLLHDMIFHSKYDPVEIDKERRVIIEEIKMYEENPIMHIHDLIEEAMFDGSTLGKNIAGDAASMLAMKREDIIDFRDRNYNPNRMIVTLAGNIPDNIMDVLESTFGTVPQRDDGSDGYSDFSPSVIANAPNISYQQKPLEQVQLSIGFYAPGRQDKDIYASKVLSTILGGTMSSRLFIEVRERRGLCYSVRSSADGYDDIGGFLINAGLDAGRLDEAAEAIFNEVQKAKSGDIKQKELDYVKDNIEGSLKLRLENSTQMAEFVGKQELWFDEVESPEQVIDHYRSVTLEDVHKAAERIFDMNNVSIAAIGPYANENDLIEHFKMVK